MILENYKNGDETQILALFNLVFGKPMSLAYWNWRFKNNPKGLTLIQLIWENDLLVGHYAVSPVKMKVNGEIILTALSGTIMTHPEFAGRGIFTELANSTYLYIEEKHNVKVNWGFPNSNSHYGYANKLGWKDLAVVHSMYLPVTKFKINNSIEIERINQFTEAHVSKMEQVMANFSVKVERDLKYLNWRYIENPVVDYFKYNVKTPNEEGFIIIKKFKSNLVPGTIELNIMELGLDGASLLGEILSEITNNLEETVSSANIWMSLWDKRHIQLEKCGFIPFGKQTFLGVRADANNTEIFDFRNWYYSYGDSDVY